MLLRTGLAVQGSRGREQRFEELPLSLRSALLSHAQALPGYAVGSWLCHTWGLRAQALPGHEVVNFGA